MVRPAMMAAVLATACLATPAAALFSKNSAVQNLDPAGLNKVLSSDSFLLLEFFAPWCGHCRNLVPEMEKAAKALKGTIVVGAVDADQHKELGGQYQVKGFPTLMFFGLDRKKPLQYNGGRTAKDLVQYAMREATKAVDARLGGKKQSGGGGGGGGGSQGAHVVELTDANFAETVTASKDLWLVEFYAPWCGHCKNLAPEWEAAAKDLQGSGASLGAVDATVHQQIAGEHKVQGYPTIKVFSPQGTEEYNGPRSAAGIVDYALGKLDKLGMGMSVEEATSPAAVRKECLEKKNLCVVAILPHVMDTGASGRNEYIQAFEGAAKKVRSRMMAFTWVSGGAHEAFESAFGVQYSYPTFVAINSKKNRYVVHQGAFSESGIVASLRKIEGGRAATKEVKVKDVAASFETTTPWDGKDYTPPADEYGDL